MELKLTAAERIGLVMLAEQHKHLGIREDIDPDLVKDAIYSGNEWALHWGLGYLLDDMGFENPDHVVFTVDVLDMWSFIEESYETLTPEEQEALKERLPEHTRLPPTYPGFDGNNEHEHLSAASFLVNKLDRFTNLEGRAEINSHHPTLHRYSAMLERFLQIRPELGQRLMNVDELVTLLSR